MDNAVKIEPTKEMIEFACFGRLSPDLITQRNSLMNLPTVFRSLEIFIKQKFEDYNIELEYELDEVNTQRDTDDDLDSREIEEISKNGVVVRQVIKAVRNDDLVPKSDNAPKKKTPTRQYVKFDYQDGQEIIKETEDVEKVKNAQEAIKSEKELQQELHEQYLELIGGLQNTVVDLKVIKKRILVKDFELRQKEERERVIRDRERNKRVSHKAKIEKFNPDLKNVLSVLRRIPNFNLEFSEKQKSMLTQDNKAVVVIGRSGTGKTTCAILRMVAIDLLYIAAQKLKMGEKSLKSEDIKGKEYHPFFQFKFECFCLLLGPADSITVILLLFWFELCEKFIYEFSIFLIFE